MAGPQAGEIPRMWTRQGPYVLDWPDLGRGLARIAEEIRSAGFAPTVIYAIARGGLIPASYLASALGVERMRVVRVRRTEDDGRYAAKRPPVIDTAEQVRPERADRVLVVDDIVGTGATAELMMRHLDGYGVSETRFATLVRNHVSAYVPRYCGFVVDDWVIFPWESDWHARPRGWRPMPEPATGP